MSDENIKHPSRCQITPESVALAIESARRSTPDLKYGACDIEMKDWEEVLGRMVGPQIFTAWTGPTDEPLYAAVTGNGPTSEVNALFFSLARDMVIALGEEVQRLRELETIVEDELIPIVEMDNEANDPSKSLYVALMRARVIIDARPLPGEESSDER